MYTSKSGVRIELPGLHLFGNESLRSWRRTHYRGCRRPPSQAKVPLADAHQNPSGQHFDQIWRTWIEIWNVKNKFVYLQISPAHNGLSNHIIRQKFRLHEWLEKALLWQSVSTFKLRFQWQRAFLDHRKLTLIRFWLALFLSQSWNQHLKLCS